MGGWVCLGFPLISGKVQPPLPPPGGGCQLFWVGGWLQSFAHRQAQGRSFFAGVFLSMGNIGGRPSSVTPPPPVYGWAGRQVGVRVGRWVNQNPREASLPPPPPQVSLSNSLVAFWRVSVAGYFSRFQMMESRAVMRCASSLHRRLSLGPGARSTSSAPPGPARLRRERHLAGVLARRIAGVRVVLEDTKRENAAAILRTCDALGVPEVFLVHNRRPDGRGHGRNDGLAHAPEAARLNSVVRRSKGCSWYLSTRTFLSSAAALDALRADG